MIILACETSTLLGSVAVIKDGHVLSEKQLMRQGSHTDILNPFIHECLSANKLTLQDVDCFATGIGPGSFTGIRISLNTIKTFAYVLDKPIFAENSLAILAEQAKSLNTHITAIINAYKNMVYLAQYAVTDGVLREITPPQVVRVQQLGQFITAPTLVVGDGFNAYEKYFSDTLKQSFIRSLQAQDHPTAAVLGKMAFAKNKFEHWSTLLPLYLRASEAEENIQGIKYQPL